VIGSRSVGVAILVVVSSVAPASGGVPGYFEWVLWKEVKTQNYRNLEWVVGPYAQLSECEQERDQLAHALVGRVDRSNTWSTTAPGGGIATDSSGNDTVRLFCVPDSVNPRIDPRWP
jgi:hypothetical protein